MPSPHPVQPLRVIIGCDTFSPDVNGAARFAERLAAGLSQRGVTVDVVAPAPKGVQPGLYSETVEGVQIHVHRLQSHKLWGHDWLRFVLPWRARWEAKRLLDTLRPDAVHLQSHILVGRGFAAEAKKRGIRIIATNHVMPENMLDPETPKIILVPFLKWAWWDENRILSKAEKVTTPTRRAAEFLERHTSQRGVIPVSCGIDQKRYTARFTERTSNRMVFVGRINQEKQLDVILQAMTHLPKDLNVQFDIVGGGDQREAFEELSRSLGVNDRVIWHGLLPDEELRLTLTNASVFTIASTAELQSIATLEAMASGLPIVAANAMALPHLVDEGVNGYLFEPGNARDLAAKVTAVLTASPTEFEAMQQASLSMAAEHDIECTLTKFEQLYRGEE